MDSVLIIEDSRAMQKAIQRIFAAESFVVETAADGITGLQMFRENLPSAVILDLKLPGISGRDLCREFKSISSTTPIVVVSANSETDDKVLLLELGADDYVTKPFSPKELLARVRRAIRRTQEAPATSVQTNTGSVKSFSDVQVKYESMEVTKNGRKIQLTAQEFRTLKYFLEHPGKVISRDELLNEVWGYTNYPSTRTVDNHVLRLRHKLEPDPSNPKFFVTLHGSGYRFDPSGA
ncbi:MAG TPA: response regulator transcription factor [Terriglobales bacterium]|nr:response regulator transcription factor [Terriglobales bacterium]